MGGNNISLIAVLDVDIACYQVAISCKNETEEDVVKQTMDLYMLNWLEQVGTTQYVGYITESSKNFRLQVATTWPYKGQRKKDKPIWHKFLRQYVQDVWKCQNVIGIEADDALVIASKKLKELGYEPVIATEDKDLLQYPCLHYNPNRSKRVFRVSKEQGNYNLWHQVITGDRTDNIPGVSHAITESMTGRYNKQISDSDLPLEEKVKLFKKYPLQEQYGKAGAKKYLDLFEPEDYPRAVLELYIDKYEDLEDEGSKGYGELRFYETFSLIYMLEEEPDGVVVDLTVREPPVPDGIEFEIY